MSNNPFTNPKHDHRQGHPVTAQELKADPQLADDKNLDSLASHFGDELRLGHTSSTDRGVFEPYSAGPQHQSSSRPDPYPNDDQARPVAHATHGGDVRRSDKPFIGDKIKNLITPSSKSNDGSNKDSVVDKIKSAAVAPSADLNRGGQGNSPLQHQGGAPHGGGFASPAQKAKDVLDTHEPAHPTDQTSYERNATNSYTEQAKELGNLPKAPQHVHGIAAHTSTESYSPTGHRTAGSATLSSSDYDHQTMSKKAKDVVHGPTQPSPAEDHSRSAHPYATAHKTKDVLGTHEPSQSTDQTSYDKNSSKPYAEQAKGLGNLPKPPQRGHDALSSGHGGVSSGYGASSDAYAPTGPLMTGSAPNASSDDQHRSTGPRGLYGAAGVGGEERHGTGAAPHGGGGPGISGNEGPPGPRGGPVDAVADNGAPHGSSASAAHLGDTSGATIVDPNDTGKPSFVEMAKDKIKSVIGMDTTYKSTVTGQEHVK